MFDIEELKKILKESIEDFYKNDNYLIENTVHEQAETHRIAHYIEKNIQDISNYSIDVEYNRNLNEQKVLYDECSRRNSQEESCQNCICRKNIFFKTDKKRRPDIIFHKRGGNDDNLFVLEAKKNDCIEKDTRKLTYLTCKKAKYKYKLGILLVLKKEQVSITFFEKGLVNAKRIGIVDGNWGISWEEENKE